MNEETRWIRLQNAASRLNHEAGKNKANWAGTKKKPQFIPCAKAGVLIAGCSSDEALPEIFIDAYNTPCVCHGLQYNAPFWEFQDFALDDSYRTKQ